MGVGFRNESYTHRSPFDQEQLAYSWKTTTLFVVDLIYLQRSFNNVYKCFNQGTKALAQFVCITYVTKYLQLFLTLCTVFYCRREKMKRNCCFGDWLRFREPILFDGSSFYSCKVAGSILAQKDNAFSLSQCIYN